MDYLQYKRSVRHSKKSCRFKPYYKWITFNTWKNGEKVDNNSTEVLNLIINGLPSIQ